MNKDTPLYRLYHNGASHLSTSELLSIVIGPGMGEQKAIKLSNDILNCFELNEIGAATIDELNNIQGITKMKASVISAMFELSHRYVYEAVKDKERISSPDKVFELMHPVIGHLHTEHFIALLVGTKNNLLKTVHISSGSLNANVVHPREVFAPAIAAHAASIIVAHNHPSGDPTPSQSDIEITNRLAKTGKIIGIELYDHVIIGADRFISLKEEELIKL